MRRWLKLYESSANLLQKDDNRDISQRLIDDGFSEFPFDQLGIIPRNVRSALNSVKRRTGLVFEKFLLWVSHLDTVEQDVRSLVEPTLPLDGLARQTKKKNFSFRSFSIDIPETPESETEPPEAIKLMINEGVGNFEFELHFEKWFPVETTSVRMMNAMVSQTKKDADHLFKSLLELTKRRWGTYEPVLEWPRLLRSAARGWALVSVLLSQNLHSLDTELTVFTALPNPGRMRFPAVSSSLTTQRTDFLLDNHHQVSCGIWYTSTSMDTHYWMTRSMHRAG